jgi:WD40 repeat protein
MLGQSQVRRLAHLRREEPLFCVPVARDPYANFAFSPDGRFLATQATNATSVNVWELQINAVGAPPVLVLETNLTKNVPAVFSPDGRTLAMCPGSLCVWFYDLIDGSLTPLALTVTVVAGAAAFSPDGNLLVTAGATGSPEWRVCIRDIASRRIVASTPFQVGPVGDLAFSPDGKWLAMSEERGTIWLWEPTSRGRWRRLAGQVGGATTLAFSPDGRTLASGAMDHTVRLWHPDIDQEVAILTGHAGWLWDIAFADDGNVLLSGGSDGTLRLWRSLSYEQIQAQAFSVETIESK